MIRILATEKDQLMCPLEEEVEVEDGNDSGVDLTEGLSRLSFAESPEIVPTRPSRISDEGMCRFKPNIRGRGKLTFSSSQEKAKHVLLGSVTIMLVHFLRIPQLMSRRQRPHRRHRWQHHQHRQRPHQAVT